MQKATTSSSSSSWELTSTFPYKLYEILNDDCSESSIKWLPHGHAFRIHDKEVFTTHVMPRYFNAKKMRSFERQLNLWGFQRITCGGDTGAWRHESFVRGHPEYLESIERTATARRASAPPEFMRHQLLPGMNQQAAMFASLEEDETSALTSVSELSPSPLTSVSVSEYAQPQLASMAEQSTYNTTDSFSNVRQASAPPEFMRHQLLPGMNQQAAVSCPLIASAEHSTCTYNTAVHSFLHNNTLSTSSLHDGMNTVTAYGFNDVANSEELERQLRLRPKSYARDNSSRSLSTSLSLHGVDGETSQNTVSGHGLNVAEEELKQAPNRNESSSPMDEFSQFIESSIHLVPPNDSTGL